MPDDVKKDSPLQSAPNASDSKTDVAYEPIFVARQPVYDVNLDIVAHKLMFNAWEKKSSSSNSALEQGAQTAGLIVDGLSLVQSIFPKYSRKYFIPLSVDLLVNGAAHAMPKHLVILELSYSPPLSTQFIAACHNMNQIGYTLAINDDGGSEFDNDHLPQLAEFIKIFKINISGKKTDQLIKTSQIIKKINKINMASGLNTSQDFRLAKTLGFTFFHGDFFSRPQIIPGRSLPISVGTKMQLLRELSLNEISFDGISAIISSSISLSYRLLNYINSVSRGMKMDITSIPQAVANLGEQPLKQWLMMVMLSDLNGSVRGTNLSFISIQRGKLLSLLGEVLGYGPKEQDTLFILGLFSKLDAILDMPMEEILAPTALNKTLKDALCGVTNGLTPWLTMVAASETGNWKTLKIILAKLGIDYNKAAVLHAQATYWAMQMTKENFSDAEAKPNRAASELKKTS